MNLADVQATFCATLVDEWLRRGVRHAVVAPGSRSTPLLLALADRELQLHVVHDERAAAFVALGLGLGGTPAVLLCTSGTAAANFHPAVVEAGMSGVPMLVVTADRPPELRGVGAPQTIDQTNLYGRSVRWFHDPGVADERSSSSWRSLARRAVERAAAGPVHLNLPFREPLLGTAGELPPASPVDPLTVAGGQRPIAPSAIKDRLGEALQAERAVILAGGRNGARPEEVAALSKAAGWPVLADPTSACRHFESAIPAFDALLRVGWFADTHRPELIVRIGRPAASKVLATWVADSRAVLIQVGGPGTIDPDHRVSMSLPVEALDALTEIASAGVAAKSWLSSWTIASKQAEAAITDVLGQASELSEPAVARTIADHLPPDVDLVVASSMPVRDLEWYGGPNARAYANRGANGIDGVMSTALGVALGDRPVVALVGDIAFVHDASALTALRPRRVDLRIVVVDNDGGGIFSFLPQASELPGERFEQLFGTPHRTDVVALARAHGLDATTVSTGSELVARITSPGPSVTRVQTDRADNVALHAAIHHEVASRIYR